MTFGQLIRAVRLKINDLKKSQFSDSDILIVLQESYLNVYKELLTDGLITNTKTVTLTFTPTAQEVALPVDFLKPKKVYDAENIPIPIYSEEFSTQSDFRSVYISRQTTSNLNVTPTSTKENNKLGWYTVPDSSFTVSLVYAAKPPQFGIEESDGTISIDSREERFEVPPEAHDCIVLYATAQLMATQEEEFAHWFSIYERSLDLSKQSLREDSTKDQEVVNLRDPFWE